MSCNFLYFSHLQWITVPSGLARKTLLRTRTTRPWMAQDTPWVAELGRQQKSEGIYWDSELLGDFWGFLLNLGDNTTQTFIIFYIDKAILLVPVNLPWTSTDRCIHIYIYIYIGLLETAVGKAHAAATR